MMKRAYTSAYAHSLLVLIELEKFYYCSKSSKMALIDLGGGSRTSRIINAYLFETIKHESSIMIK